MDSAKNWRWIVPFKKFGMVRVKVDIYCYSRDKWSFRINDSNTCVEHWIQLKSVLGGCCTFHWLSWTDSIKPSLQFSFLYFGVVALKGLTFTRNFITNNRKNKCILLSIYLKWNYIYNYHCKSWSVIARHLKTLTI